MKLSRSLTSSRRRFPCKESIDLGGPADDFIAQIMALQFAEMSRALAHPQASSTSPGINMGWQRAIPCMTLRCCWRHAPLWIWAIAGSRRLASTTYTRAASTLSLWTTPATTEQVCPSSPFPHPNFQGDGAVLDRIRVRIWPHRQRTTAAELLPA